MKNSWLNYLKKEPGRRSLRPCNNAVWVGLLMLIAITGCREIYEPPFESPQTGYLVVEGVINPGAEGTDITLSRTTRLNNDTLTLERGASIQIEGEDQSSFQLYEFEPGRYTSTSQILNPSQKYRMRITSGAPCSTSA